MIQDSSQPTVGGIRRGQCVGTDARDVARRFHEAVWQPDMAAVLFFCSSRFDLDALGDELHRLFGDVPVAGCTAAGEFGPLGYLDGSLSGVSLSADRFRVAAGRLDGLASLQPGRAEALVGRLQQQLEAGQPGGPAGRSFGFLMIDGLSGREEPVARALQAALGPVPLVGGSAGDDLRFARTQVYVGGRFATDAAVLVLASTTLPFREFQTQHFVPTECRMVVTGAEGRRVTEINGRPAAAEYARLIGAEAAGLDPRRFAAWPVVVVISGRPYVRSIRSANPDGSLTFLAAMEEGVVLRVADGRDLAVNLEQALAGLRGELGPLQLVLGCDCVLRKLEIAHSGDSARIARLLQAHNATGFNTYGEQFLGIHLNQTFAGLAFGEARADG
jgi:hypothetical protein